MTFMKIWERFSLEAILLLAFGLRLFQIGKRDFWYDEAFTGNLIKNDWATMMKEIAYDVHPPLHYFLLKIHASLFGYGVTSLRMFSLVCGVLSVWFVYLIGKEWFGKRAGLLAGFVAAVAPFVINYSQETRMYALYALFVLMATYCFVRALRSNQYRWWMGWGASFAFACLTHYMAFLFAPCFCVAWIIMRVDVKQMWHASIRERWRALRVLLPSRGFILGMGTSLLVFAPWLSTFLQQLSHSKEISVWKTPARLVDVFRNVQIFIFGTPKGERSLWAFDPNVIAGFSPETIALVVTLLFAVFVAFVFRRERRTVAAVFAFFAGPLLLSYALSFFDKYYFISRYVLPCAFFLYVLVGVWLSRLSVTRAGVALAIYLACIAFIQWPQNSEGYNALHARLPEYSDYHFYSLNTFDYVLAKYYIGANRLTLYNVGWPQYDSRPWPGVGYETKRTEHFEDVKNDPQGIVIWNTQFPLEQRDDRNFDTTEFEKIATYKNIELYRSKKFVE